MADAFWGVPGRPPGGASAGTAGGTSGEAGAEASPDAGWFAAGAVPGVGPGSRIAGYLLEEQVGQGGIAVVFRARDERLGRQVALKALAPAPAADAAFRQRFIRESRAAAAVDDPHIIPVYEAGDAGGVLFIATRYVPGSDVRTLIDREGPLPAARAAAIISPVPGADRGSRHRLPHRGPGMTPVVQPSALRAPKCRWPAIGLGMDV